MDDTSQITRSSFRPSSQLILSEKFKFKKRMIEKQLLEKYKAKFGKVSKLNELFLEKSIHEFLKNNNLD